MADPVEHLTPLGGVADWFDKEFQENEKFLAEMIRLNEEAMNDPKTSYAEKGLRAVVDLWGYEVVVVHGVSGRIAQGFVDVFRIGDGVFVERSWVGAGKDALRLLNIIPLAGP